MESLPKLKFRFITNYELAEILAWSSLQRDGALPLAKGTYYQYPEIKDIAEKGENRLELIEEAVQKRYEKFIMENKKLPARYAEKWEPYNDAFIDKLTHYFHLKEPLPFSTIESTIGDIPVCQIYIEEHQFDLHIKNHLIETSFHEILHMVFFEKCKELFPKWEHTDFNPPSILWYLSEIMVDPVLNSDKIQEVYSYNFRAYPSFYEPFMKGQSLVEIITTYFKQYEIEEAIFHSYQFLENNENTIHTFYHDGMENRVENIKTI